MGNHKLEFTAFDRLNIDINESKRSVAEETEACSAIKKLIFNAQESYEKLTQEKDRLLTSISLKRRAFDSNLSVKESLTQSIESAQARHRLVQEELEALETKNDARKKKLTELRQRIYSTLNEFQTKYPDHFTDDVLKQIDELTELKKNIAEAKEKLKESNEHGWSNWRKAVVNLAKLVEKRKQNNDAAAKSNRAMNEQLNKQLKNNSKSVKFNVKSYNSERKSPSIQYTDPRKYESTPYPFKTMAPFTFKKFEIPKFTIPKFSYKKIEFKQNQERPAPECPQPQSHNQSKETINKNVNSVIPCKMASFGHCEDAEVSMEFLPGNDGTDGLEVKHDSSEQSKEKELPDVQNTSGSFLEHDERTNSQFVSTENVENGTNSITEYQNLEQNQQSFYREDNDECVVEEVQIPVDEKIENFQQVTQVLKTPSHERIPVTPKTPRQEPARPNFHKNLSNGYIKPDANVTLRLSQESTRTELDSSFLFQFGGKDETPATNALALFGTSTDESPDVPKETGKGKPNFSLFGDEGGDDTGFFSSFQRNTEKSSGLFSLFDDNEQAETPGPFKLF